MPEATLRKPPCRMPPGDRRPRPSKFSRSIPTAWRPVLLTVKPDQGIRAYSTHGGRRCGPSAISRGPNDELRGVVLQRYGGQFEVTVFVEQWPTVTASTWVRASAEGMGRKFLIARIIIEAHITAVRPWRSSPILHSRGKSLCLRTGGGHVTAHLHVHGSCGSSGNQHYE